MINDTLHLRFEKFDYSYNILNNIQPLLSIYIIFLLIILTTKFLLPRISSFFQNLKEKNPFNILLGLFLITLPEELFICLLHFKHIKFDTSYDYIGFSIAIILILHLLVLLIVILKKLLIIPARFDEDDNFSKIFSQCWDREVKVNRLYTFSVMMLKIVMVSSIVFIDR